MFRKLYALLVLSGLLFPYSDEGVAWELIDMVDDIDWMVGYNWPAVVWQFLVDAINETTDKMRTRKNLQINEFVLGPYLTLFLLLFDPLFSCVLC